jgi:hypothetical protein
MFIEHTQEWQCLCQHYNSQWWQCLNWHYLENIKNLPKGKNADIGAMPSNLRDYPGTETSE